MSALVAFPIGAPLAAAAVSIALGRWRQAQRVLGVATLTTTLVSAVALLAVVDRDGIRVAQAGGWPAPYGITLAADRLAAVMLVISALMLLAVLVYAVAQGGPERRHVGFHPVYLMLSAGIAASFLAGDLFNLFVSFEVMLTASYVLLTLGGRRDQVRAGMTYVVISLLASILFLTTIAFIYTSTGTVNLAHLTGQLEGLPRELRQTVVLLLLVVFGVKAAVFPLFFWLPDSYPTAPTAITAVFAGLLTKVGIYAIVRTQTLLLPTADRPEVVLLAVAAATMVVGVVGAIAQMEIKRILSFQIVSQVGFILMGLAFFSVAGMAAAILYIVHHIIVETTLFLTAGLVEDGAGTGHLDRLSGLTRTSPLLGVLFLLPALSLAGVPPFSGFVAKLGLVQAGFADGQYAVVAVSLAVSFLTLFSMIKIWNNIFWGNEERSPEARGQAAFDADGAAHKIGRGLPRVMVASTATLIAASVAVVLFAEPLYRLTTRAATDLLDPSAYVEAVLDR